ncbi:helix-turn-helix domain-containing protein [Macrococcoides canis]|uniref:XRE family transcriptional regulator n=1 Tax=Macrococcoides canis TaxID=1855823 RepID=A0A4R6C1W1_9STAP|nr:XRE family transcriptional regulator [Macrococcus canis]MEE1108278.1 XRE family transcriptional regulator [Macrococcus canis]TDM15300.1 XRE family transcriptional regulator [Macrococcus canis]TDM20890.1 XRE family transcriptional regulator [Macrococcus canis]TDM24558.1 XRE family transcriptional regulator [Macrococcus canis]TDM32493.1 XRE family transcriptional regulator [Macrococcus canis]
MDIGKKIKDLRRQKNLTQEELGERTDLSKGYISQLERNLCSPSMETFFNILEVLGSKPKDFFSEQQYEQRIYYPKSEQTIYDEYDDGYMINWLVPDSNEFDMEPVIITIEPGKKYKKFLPSMSDSFIYVLQGEASIHIGRKDYHAKCGESFYFKANESHQLFNRTDKATRVLIVATESYL